MCYKHNKEILKIPATMHNSGAWPWFENQDSLRSVAWLKHTFDHENLGDHPEAVQPIS
jgi:hypothetical protein